MIQMKVCTRCKGEPQPIKDFGIKNKAKGWRHCYCKECMKLFRKESYRARSGPYLERAIQAKQRNRELFFEYLKKHPCVDCGNDNPIVLEPDHVRGKKTAGVSRLLRNGSWAQVERELKKCEIRCSNCHKIKTSKEQNWFKRRAA
jgi:hypothetical protein